MNERLRNAIEALRNLDRSLSPVEYGRARENALIEGLHGLAGEYGRKIGFTRIDANGEMDFNIEGSTPHAHDGTYGEELAGWLSEIRTRTGVEAYQRNILPQNNWCRIHHFEVERLLGNVAERMPSIDADGPAASRAP